MKVKSRNILFYVVTIGLFSALMYVVMLFGKQHETGKMSGEVIIRAADKGALQLFKESFLYNITHPLAILILQIITIVIVARVFGFFFNKIGQPSVIGEIVAGIFLGPSFVGLFYPEFSEFLFPLKSLANLQFLSQFGLIFFMFVIGMELDLNVLKNKANDAIVISHASIIIPFALGVSLAYFLYIDFAPDTIHFVPFSLFMGIAMSITAFPVLARIIQERGLTKTRLGTIAITCAAADDITAWCLLAAVIAVAKAGEFTSAFFTIVMATAYVLLMIKIVRPFLQRMGDIYSNRETIGPVVVGISFLTLLISSYLTEIIGIHALFGAFFAGVMMPANLNFRKVLINKVEDVALIILLPLFFVFTGLRTQIGLLNEPHLWQTCALIILVAIIGKFGGSAFSARFVGQTWRESLSIGALMNTRGLMELVVLNIGYDLGVLSPQIFAMMVLMALITTFMTAPAMSLIDKLLPEKKPEAVADAATAELKILVSFANPVNGKKLLRLANYLTNPQNGNTAITMMHLHPNPNINPYNAAEYERESFAPINDEARSLGVKVKNLYKISHDVTGEVVSTVNKGGYDMLLVGVGPSLFKGTLLGNLLGFTAKALNPEKIFETIKGKEKWKNDDTLLSEKTKEFIEESRCSVGIFIDKKFTVIEKIFVPIFNVSDLFLSYYIKQFVRSEKVKVEVLDIMYAVHKEMRLKGEMEALSSVAPDKIILLGDISTDKDFLSRTDLLLVSYESWKKLVESQSEWLANSPSVLIIKP